MAGEPFNRWVWLGVALGSVGFMLVAWFLAWVNNWVLSTTSALLVLGLILQPLYQRWSRRRQRADLADHQ
jgi:drug/metabolite transporter (DMT)-like permease